MIRSDCIHYTGCDVADGFCSYVLRGEFIRTCAGCGLYERVMTPVDILLFKVDDLTDENARLRELVARIARYKFYPCDGCMHREWCDSHPIDLLTPRAWCPEQVDIENECKVLGIEVH